MRKIPHKKQILSFALTGALILSVLSTDPIKPAETSAATNIMKIKLDPDAASTFHDTNGDGYGEFEGFGTSLCWWANRCGYDTTLTNEAAKLLYNKEQGLGLTIGRYNIGGGDNPSHKHITRSDSKMPGFWSSPKKVSNASQGASYDAYDATSQYAWNYNWNADINQLNVALACQKEAGTEFQAETFSNSAPYFMTVSGCTSGSKDGQTTNLRADSYQAFAAYLTDVTKYLKTKKGLNITSITGMNEPESGSWTAKSPKQEGCHISAGKPQSKVIMALSSKLKAAGLGSLTLSASDSSEVFTGIESINSLSTSALSRIHRIDNHAYTDASMPTLRELAQKKKKNLWMSEVDGTAIAGTKAGEMSAALGFSGYLNRQLNGLQPSAWIIWDAIDVHIDSSNKADLNSLSDANRIANDKNGFWGILYANHDTKKIIKSKKYYAYGQYSRYIRPGYTLIGSSDNSVAAYDTKSHTAVIVVTNTKGSNQKCQIDLSKFTSINKNSTVKAIRTSGTLANGENWKDVSKSSSTTFNRSGKKLTTVLKKNSITTYILSGVSLPSKRASASFKRITVHQNQITAKTAKDGSDLPGNLVDQDYDSEYACKQGNAVIDLGKKYKVSAIAFSASSISNSYTQNIQFYGSNNKKKWTRLFTITGQPSSMTLNYVNAKSFAAKKRQFRYLKFRKKNGKTAISELRIFGTTSASDIATKFPKKIKSSKKLPKKIRLKNGKQAKVSYYTVYRGTNDNMTKKQRRTVQITAHLKKSLPGYGKTVNQNITMSPSLYKKWKGTKITFK